MWHTDGFFYAFEGTIFFTLVKIVFLQISECMAVVIIFYEKRDALL